MVLAVNILLFLVIRGFYICTNGSSCFLSVPVVEQGGEAQLVKTMQTREIEDKVLSPAQRRHYRQQLKKRLIPIRTKISKLTNRTPLMPTQILLYSDKGLSSPQFCGTWEDKKLKVANQVLSRPLLLDIVLYRELYTSLLPPVVRQVPESSDLGLLCAFYHFTEKQQKRLLKVWQAVSPRRYFGDITYDAPLSLPLFNRVTQGMLLRQILPFFDELEPASSPLTSQEYVDLLETFMLNYSSPLNEQELRILHLLQEHPNATIQQLHEYSSISVGSLSNYLSGFREKLLFSRFYRVNFPKIRLNHLAVLAYPAPGSRVNRFFYQCPYIRKVHRFGGAGAPYLVTYAIPRLRTRRLQEWLQELVGLGHLSRFRVYPLSGVFHGYNVRSYLAHANNVPIAERFRWVAWIRYLRDVLIRDGYGEVLTQPYIYEYSNPNIEPVQLEPLDYQMLALISPDTTAETLAQSLGESIHTIRRRQRELFAQNVLFERPDISLFHLGLNESIFIILEGSETTVRNFLAGCREAPMHGGSIFNHPTPGCIVAFGLPTGLALKVGQRLTSLFLDQSDFDAAVFYGNGSKDFAITSVLKRCPFNSEQNQWTWHREYLPTVFDHVDSQQHDLTISDGLQI